MIFEEVLKITTAFAKGDLIILVTDDDEIYRDMRILAMDNKGLTIGYERQEKQIAWKNIVFIGQRGMRVIKEPMTALSTYKMDFMTYEKFDMAIVEVFGIQVSEKRLREMIKLELLLEQKEEKERKFYRCTGGDPFTWLFDELADVSYGRPIYSEDDDRLVNAASWIIGDQEKYGLLSFHSQIIEVGSA